MTMTATKERPILFSSPMIRAILDGRKSMTRRVVTWRNSTCLGSPAKPFWPNLYFDHAVPMTDSTLLMAITGERVDGRDVHLRVPWCHPDDYTPGMKPEDMCQYRVRSVIDIGDRLYVREAWATDPCYNHITPRDLDEKWPIYYESGDGKTFTRGFHRVRPSIHMPKWASRLTLEVTAVRVERLQRISEEDAIAEGAQCPPTPASLTDRGGFAKLWDSINGKKHPWESNPFVWMIEFQRAGGER